MAIEAKEVVLYIRKFLLFSIKTSYKTVRGHPLISAVVFLLLMLYRIFPSLFAFLVTSSPVIICTALLLGTLLSYGTPNMPKIEEAKKTTHDISSMQVERAVGNVVTKNDKNNLVVETHEEVSREVVERSVEEEAGNVTVRDVPFATIHDMGIHIDGETKDRNDEKRLIEEREDSGSSHDVGDDGLKVNIVKPESDNLFDSSLGSPWQPINSHHASSDSDSDSSGSSSPDASMSDIIPMLDELHPLLDSEHPQATMRSTGYSDSSSSESSRDDESDGGTAEEEEIENKEDIGKDAVQEEECGGNEDAVTWNADDQKNVMDLGVSELERNRRLESLIEKRRVRKLIRYETEKNLIDLDSYYPTPIPSISALRRNPFDHSNDSVPGSAPSALHRKENPFDLPYDQVERISSFSREYLSHHDFIPSHEKDMLSGMHESSALGPSYPDDVYEEKDDSNLKSYMQETEFTSFQRQSSEESDSKSSSESESNKILSVMGQDSSFLHVVSVDEESDSKSSAESESNKVSSIMGQGSNFLHAANVDAEHVDVDRSASTVVEESHQPADSFHAVEEETGEAAANLPLSHFVKSEITEARYEESNSSSSEENEKSSEMHIHEESSNLLQSDTAFDMPVANPVYDSSPSSVGKTISNTSSLDEASLYKGKDDFASSSLPSDAREDYSKVMSPPKPVQTDESVENIDYVEVRETAEEELSLPKASSSASSLDETESRSMEITEIKEHDEIQAETSKATEDVPLSGSREILTVDVDESTQSEGDYITDISSSREEPVIHSCPEAQVSISDLHSIPEEHVDDFKFGGEHENAIEPNFQVIEEPDLHPKASKNITNDDDDDDDDDDDTKVLVPEADTQTESKEFSTLSKTTSDSSHSEGNVTDGEMYAGSTEIREIDEGLLSELDAVSDFQVDKEIKLNQGDSNTLDASRAETNDIHLEDTLRIAEEVNPVMDHSALLETEVDSSVVPSREDPNPELTVYNSKLHILEASSLEELDSVFEQQHEKKIDKDPEIKETVPQHLVVEEKSIEDIDLVPKQSLSELEHSEEDLSARINVAYIEAKSLEDIDFAFKQLSEGTVKDTNPPEFSQGESSSQRQLEDEVSEGTAAIDDVSGSTASNSRKNRKKSGSNSSSSSIDSE